MSVPPPGSLPLEASSPCPNCGQPWPPNAPACPNCGFLRPVGSSWPPTPIGQAETAPRPSAPSKLVTSTATGDILLGLGLSALLFVMLGAGLLVVPVLYLALRRQYPVFARGLGFGWLGGSAIILGAFALCVLSLSASHPGGS